MKRGKAEVTRGGLDRGLQGGDPEVGQGRLPNWVTRML